MIDKLMVKYGAVIMLARMWVTEEFVADESDVEKYGCELGEDYVFWCATKDGRTKSGNKVKKGSFFFVPAD